MSSPDYVWEIRHETWDEFPGNELYDDLKYAKWMGMDDFLEAYPGDGVLTWEAILKGFFVLYEDGLPTELTLRARGINKVEK